MSHTNTVSSESAEKYPRAPWFAPDPRIRTKKAQEDAIHIAEWATSGFNQPPVPTEEQLFIALHTAAYKAGQTRAPQTQRDEWTERWATVREYIVKKNLGLVYSMLGRFSTKRADEDDLLSDAMLALTRAVDRFNPWRGYRFSTYACNVIARALMRRGKRESNYRRLFPVQHDISFEHQESTTDDTNSDLYLERLRRALDRNIGELSEIECHILAKRFPDARGAKLTFQEIGSTVGLSKERVRQIQNVALAKLREVLTEDPVLQ